MDGYRDLIRENIGYDDFVREHPYDAPVTMESLYAAQVNHDLYN